MFEITSKVKTAFAKLVKDGKTPNELKGWLVAQAEVPFNEVARVYKELDGPVIQRRGFRDGFYTFLKEGIKNAAQVAEYVKANGSENDIRNTKFYQGLAELTNDIHAK